MADRPAPSTGPLDVSAPAAPIAARHAVLRYTTLRLGLFVAAAGLLWLTGAVKGLLLVALAVLISGLASYALLQSQRQAMSAAIATARESRAQRAAARAAREDAIADELSGLGVVDGADRVGHGGAQVEHLVERRDAQDAQHRR